METSQLSTHQKALSINMNDKIYGTLAEIGAAQEVARWLFRVGGAAGSFHASAVDAAATARAAPRRVSATAGGESGIDLPGSTATDAQPGSSVYLVYRAGSPVGQSLSTSFSDEGLAITARFGLRF